MRDIIIKKQRPRRTGMSVIARPGNTVINILGNIERWNKYTQTNIVYCIISELSHETLHIVLNDRISVSASVGFDHISGLNHGAWTANKEVYAKPETYHGVAGLVLE